jgi:hypothetical protein
MDKRVEEFYLNLKIPVNKILHSRRRQRSPEITDEAILDALGWMYEQVTNHGLEVGVPGMMCKIWEYASNIEGRSYVTEWRNKVLLLEHELYKTTLKGRIIDYLDSVVYGEDW